MGQVMGAHDVELALHLVHHFHRIAHFAVQLVHEGEDGVSRRRVTSISLRVRSSTPLAASMTIRQQSTAVRVR